MNINVFQKYNHLHWAHKKFNWVFSCKLILHFVFSSKLLDFLFSSKFILNFVSSKLMFIAQESPCQEYEQQPSCTGVCRQGRCTCSRRRRRAPRTPSSSNYVCLRLLLALFSVHLLLAHLFSDCLIRYSCFILHSHFCSAWLVGYGISQFIPGFDDDEALFAVSSIFYFLYCQLEMPTDRHASTEV